MSRCHVILRRVGLDAYELLDFDLSREDPEHASLGMFLIHGQDATFKPNVGGKELESVLSVRSLVATGSASIAGVSDLRIWRGARQLLSLIDADERPDQA